MYTTVKRINFRSILLSVLSGAALLFLIGLWLANPIVPYFRAKFSAASQVTLAELNRGTIPIPGYFSKVDGDATYNTGYVLEERERIVFYSANYYGLLQIGNKFLLIYTDDVPDETRKSWVGTLETGFSFGEEEMIREIEGELPEIAGAILPYKLDVIDAEHFSWWINVSIGIVFAVLAVIVFVRGLQALTDPSTSSIWRGLARFGDDIPATIAAVERDLRDNAMELGQIKVGNEWMVLQAPLAFQLMRITDIVWIYPETTTKRVNNVTQEVLQSAVFHDKYSKSFRVHDSSAAAAYALNYVAERVPWAKSGHSSENRAMWRRHRKQFIEQVGNHKNEIQLEEDRLFS